MLDLRPVCENCGCSLPPESLDAMICSFECTFCATCVATILLNVCPNCGGGFEKRPIRPVNSLRRYPATDKVIYQPLIKEKHQPLLKLFKDVDPAKR